MANEARDRREEETAHVDEPKAARGLCLLVLGTEIATYPLPERGEVSIGRSSSNAVVVDDATVSRQHAVLRLGPAIEIVDLGSRHGTRVGSATLTAQVPARLAAGDLFHVGNTMMVLQPAASGARPRRLWSHGFFEARLEDECARAERSGRGFAVLRVRAEAHADLAAIEQVLVERLRTVDVLASYAPGDYEALVVDAPPPEARQVEARVIQGLEARGVAARTAMVHYPRDGRTPESLVAGAGQALRPVGGRAERPTDLGRSATFRRLEPIVERVARSGINVLVLGETGVGKEVMTQWIHALSPRADRPILNLNCSALSETLLESELFGYEKGAFTGAHQAKPGLLETAQGGTVFLDEIGEMPLALQAKLLRVIEERKVMRIGALKPKPIDVRFIAATNRDLEEEGARGRFRQDLYFRLNGISIVLPPLRERRDEIAPLARAFVIDACNAQGRERVLDLAPAALEALEAYSWPGNIRELKNIIERAVVLCGADTIGLEHLPAEKMGRVIASPGQPGGARSWSYAPRPSSPPPEAATAAEPATDLDRIIDALERCAGNQTRAAKLLGISRRTLTKRLGRYDLPRPRKPSDPTGE